MAKQFVTTQPRNHAIAVLLRAICLITLVGSPILEAGTAQADNPTFEVMNTSETPPDGVWFRNSPSIEDTDAVSWHDVRKGEHMQVECYQMGEPFISKVRNGDTIRNGVWYYGVNTDRRTYGDNRPNTGFMNTHHIQDGQQYNKADGSVSPAPGIPMCGATNTQSTPEATPMPKPTLAPTPIPTSTPRATPIQGGRSSGLQNPVIPAQVGSRSLETFPVPNLLWSGYIDQHIDSTTFYKSVTGTWTVPKVSCDSGKTGTLFIWVGLGGANKIDLSGDNSSTVVQTGTVITCSMVNGRMQATYQAVYEAWGAQTKELNYGQWIPFSLPAKSGDTFTATVTYQDGVYNLTLVNKTERNAIGTEALELPASTPNSAEWIAEDVSGTPLPRFGPIKLTDCYAEGAPAGNGPMLNQVKVMAPKKPWWYLWWGSPTPTGPVKMDTDTLPQGNTSFSVKWHRY